MRVYGFTKMRNGLYTFLLNGKIKVNDNELNKRDGIGLWSVDGVLKYEGLENSKILTMEVPMAI